MMSRQTAATIRNMRRPFPLFGVTAGKGGGALTFEKAPGAGGATAGGGAGATVRLGCAADGTESPTCRARCAAFRAIAHRSSTHA